MKSLTRLQAFAAVGIAAAWLTPDARAGRFDVRTAPVTGLHASAPRVRTVALADGNDRAPIVGLWKIQFPVTGIFCRGVWKQTGRRTFSLSHWALTWQADGMTFIGPANITEVVTILGVGDSYKGTFQITQYDQTGKTPLGGPSGVVVGTRIKP